MVCPHCEKEIAAIMDFCPYCGKLLPYVPREDPELTEKLRTPYAFVVERRPIAGILWVLAIWLIDFLGNNMGYIFITSEVLELTYIALTYILLPWGFSTFLLDTLWYISMVKKGLPVIKSTVLWYVAAALAIVYAVYKYGTWVMLGTIVLLFVIRLSRNNARI